MVIPEESISLNSFSLMKHRPQIAITTELYVSNDIGQYHETPLFIIYSGTLLYQSSRWGYVTLR